MNLIDFEKSMGKAAMRAEEAIAEGMKKYNLDRLVINVAEIVKDVWKSVGFKTDSMDFTYHGSGVGICPIAVKDSQLELLTSSDLSDLCKAINADFIDTPLKRWANVDAMVRPGEKGIWIEIEVLHPITQARQFCKFWQDVSAKGTKEMGL